MKINNYRENHGSSAAKASFNVELETESGLFNINLALFQKSDGEIWIKYPCREYFDKENNKKYYRLACPTKDCQIQFEKELKDELIQSSDHAARLLKPESQTEFELF